MARHTVSESSAIFTKKEISILVKFFAIPNRKISRLKLLYLCPFERAVEIFRDTRVLAIYNQARAKASLKCTLKCAC